MMQNSQLRIYTIFLAMSAGCEFKFQEQRMYSGGLYTESIE